MNLDPVNVSQPLKVTTLGQFSELITRWENPGIRITDETIRVWNFDTNECVTTLEGHSHRSSLSLSRDGRTLVSGSWDKTILVWNLNTNECVTILEGHSSSVNSVSLSRDGRPWYPDLGQNDS
jgi:WD40 repeat protein